MPLPIGQRAARLGLGLSSAGLLAFPLLISAGRASPEAVPPPLATLAFDSRSGNKSSSSPRAARPVPATGGYQASVVNDEWFDPARNRHIPVKLYLPTGQWQRTPVILFSHGLGGSRDNASYLGQAWAQHGFVCVFLQHPGSDQSLWADRTGTGRSGVLRALKAGANGRAALDRIKDVKFALDHLEALASSGTGYGRMLDLSRVGMSGHSFGALTSLWLAGQKVGLRAGQNRISLAEPRIDAALYLSPGRYNGRIAPDTAFAGIKIPGMVVTGSEDVDAVIGSTPQERAANFDYIKAPGQYLLFFDGATHLTFSGKRRAGKAARIDERIQTQLAEVTCRFWDAYLRQDPRAVSWLKGGELEHFLGTSGSVRKK